MDIEYQVTPPKKAKRNYEFSTPNHKTTPKDTETPKKSRATFDSPCCDDSSNILSTPTKNSLKEKSRKQTKNSSNSPHTPSKSPADKLVEDYEGFNMEDNMN
jgi:hypothetical protein